LEEVWKKSLIPQMQTEFRKGRSTIDNILLNDLIQKNKQAGDKEKKIYALFADLKAAFNRMYSSLLRRYEIKLIRRLEHIYARTWRLLLRRSFVKEVPDKKRN